MTDAEKWFELSTWATRYEILITQTRTRSGISGVLLRMSTQQWTGKTLDGCVEKAAEWMKGRKENEKSV